MNNRPKQKIQETEIYMIKESNLKRASDILRSGCNAKPNSECIVK